MKDPNQYANELIEKYNIPYRNGSGYNMTEYQRIQCAIIDVENTIEALREASGCGKYFELTIEFEYYSSIIEILKTK